MPMRGRTAFPARLASASIGHLACNITNLVDFEAELR